jgi:glycosyltransferase involved in cell wall biosynthesis
MRIAMIHTQLWGRGGAERQILSLSIELQKAGHEVEIFTSAVNESACYPELLKEVKVNVVPNPLVPFRHGSASSDSSVNEVEEISSVRMWLRRIVGRQFYTSELPSMYSLGRNIPKEFDIINNHNFPSEWAAFLAKKRLKVPVVWMCNEPPFWFFLPEHKKGLRKINWPLFEVLDKVSVQYIDEIVVLSDVDAGHVKKAYNRSSRVVRTGVDFELFHNASGEKVREKYGLESDFVLLHVGNLDPYRRQADSIKALYHLSKNHKDVKLILDGAGSREELKRLCEKLDVKDRVLFLHTSSDEELTKVYAACDVFVFPSPITWGLAAIEAMATGKPAIVSKKAGASEIIQNGVNGMVVDHAKPEQIATQVELLMNNPELRNRIGENAYAYVRSNLSWEKYAQSMERVFQQTVLASKGR